MPSIYKHEMLAGRPLFSDASSREVLAKFASMTSENALLSKLRPSREKWRITRMLEKMIQAIGQFFVIKRPDVMKEKIPLIIRGGGAQPLAPDLISFGNLWTHYNRFLNGEGQSSKGLKNAFDRMSKDEAAITSLALKKNKVPQTNPQAYLDKLAKERDQFIQKNLTEVYQMKEGDSRLLLLNREGTSDQSLNGNLFCVMTKQSGDKFSLRLIGTGDLMRQLQTLPMGGKEKVMRELCFENIPKEALQKNDCLKGLITNWVDYQPATPKSILNNNPSLDPYKKEAESVSDLVTCSDRVDRLFWNVVKAFPVKGKGKQTPSAIEKKVLQKQMQLRSEVLALYDFFQNVRYDLTPHSEDYQTLVQLFKGISAKVDRSHRKGYLPQDELNKINAEFAVIERTIQRAKKTPISFKATQSAKPEIVQGLFFKDLPLKAREDISAAPASTRPPHRTEGQKPADQLVKIPGASPIPMTIYKNIDTKEAFLKAFREVFDKAKQPGLSKIEQALAMQEMSRFFNEVAFQPFVEDYDTAKKKHDKSNSFWWKFDKNEAEEVMDKMNQYTQLLIEKGKNINPNQYELESYLQMWRMGDMLHATTTGKWFTFQNTERLIYKYIQDVRYDHRLYRQVSSNYSLDRHYEFDFDKVDEFEILSGYGEFKNKDKKEVKLTAEEIKHKSTQLQLMDKFFTKPASLKDKDSLEQVTPLVPEKWPYFSDSSLSNLLINQTENHWLRPLSHRGLIGLYHYAISKVVIDWAPKGIEGDGRTTPEAFHDNPEGIFNFFADYHDEEVKPQGGEIPSGLLNDFTAVEKKHLLRLVRQEHPQVELMAFMKEFPHLMRNPEVRNFFDALFFGTSLEDLLKTGYNQREFREQMPQKLDQEIQRFELLINDALSKPVIQDPETLQSRFDTLLYYYEMKEKLRDGFSKFKLPLNHFSSSKKQLTHLLELSQTRPELQASIGYAARVHLRALLPDHTAAALPEMMKDYALCRDYAVDGRNIDPAFEAEMMRHWAFIAKQCEESRANLQPFLDLLCYEKDLAIDGSEWKRVKEYIYQNGTYQVNLRTLDVSRTGEEGNLVKLPLSIIQHPLFKKTLGSIPEDMLVSMEENGSKKIYSFKDSSGRPIQIEWLNGQPSFYTKLPIEGGKWLQILPENPFELSKLKQLKAAQEDAKIEKMGFMDMLKAFFKMKSKAEEGNALSAFSAFNMLVDPAAPNSLYCLDQKGNLAFQLNVKEGKEGLEIQSAADHRTSPISTGQINLANSYHSAGLDLLSVFENKGNMLFWSQNGKLEKIELPRYHLTFIVKGDQLMCTEPYSGYSVDLAAALQEKKGLAQALVLTHPDPKKPKKLLIPDAEAIVERREAVFPQARGFGRIKLFIEQIQEVFKLLAGYPFKVEQRLKFEMNPNLHSLSLTSFDIRPYTGEICEKRENWEADVLQLVKLALKTDQPSSAWEMLKQFQLKPQELNPKLIKDIVQFIREPLLNTGGEAALKLKLALQLKHCLKKNKQWKKNVKTTLNQEMLKLGPILFAAGRRIPNELQLTKEERIQIARLFKKKLPDYYEKHLKVHFAADGTALDLPSPSPAGKDAFDVELAEWKKSRPPLGIKERIEALETTLAPSARLSDDDLSYPIPRAEKSISLIDFSSKDEKNLFEVKKQELPSLDLTAHPSKASYEKQALKEVQESLDKYKKEEQLRPVHSIKGGKKGLKKILDSEWVPKKGKFERELLNQQADIEAFIRQSTNAGEQAAIFAGNQGVASFDELRQALAFDELAKLQKSGRLPSTLNVDQLKQRLIDYFQVLTRRNAYEAVIKLTEEILTKEPKKNQEEWDTLSEALYRLLTVSRNFDPYKDPRLLIFTAQQFINLKPLDGGLDQLTLLDALVKNPHGIVQAPTGAGKTAVLSVMRTLHKANGKNLVIQKVLPPLFQQTYDKFKDVLGDFYGTSVYALRFNLKMRLSKKETVPTPNDKGELEDKIIEHSIFKEMYLNLLETMQNKGCVLTDYKSLPLLEEMFFKIGQEIVEKNAQGGPPTPLQEEHFQYLRKILILLENKADENMDEFDQPNRPIQKIQVDLGIGGGLLPDYFFKNSIEIYEMLLKDPELGLRANIQSELSEEMRLKIIEKMAQKMAEKLAGEAGDPRLEREILAYLQGKNEDVLPHIQKQSDAYKDRLALCKDQFSIYLPLTLRFKEGSRYARSEDGSKTLPAYNGEKHEAQFGTPLEQINYAIQDYLQKGITLYDLKPWLKDIKQRWEESEDAAVKKDIMDQFHEIFPNLTIIEAAQIFQKEEGAQKLLDQINQDTAKITPFLLTRLRKMKSSGAIISMDPQNNVDMSRVVSAVSATMGAPESLHRQFQVDKEMNGKIQANMIYRVKNRALQEKVIAYDPADPESMLKEIKTPLKAIIDGAGAFPDAAQGAAILKKSQPSLEQVGYHKADETIGFVGKATGDLAETGFDFSQSHTRGTDIQLAGDAVALLTLTEKDGIREVFQKEGRLRQKRQRYLLAMPKYQGIKTVTQEIGHAITQDAAVDAKDIFRKCKQEPKAIVRKAMKKRLFDAQTLSEFIALFQNNEWRSYFITQPENSFDKAGSYFVERQHIQFDDQAPEKVLKAYKANLTQKAKDWGLLDAVEKLDKIEYSDELLAKMPEKVAPIGSAQGELEAEVEVEQEQEAEEEQEMELEFETETQQEQVKAQQKALGVYPLRIHSDVVHSVAGKIHSAYDPLLQVTDAFLPFSREGKPLPQKKPFDAGMYRIGTVYFEADYNYSIFNPKYDIKRVMIEDPLEDYKISGFGFNKVAYDIRLNSFVDKSLNSTNLQKEPQFAPLIAQIKFLDGRVNGYSSQELQALSNWLSGHDPKKMRDHLLNDILCFRYQDKQAFAGSQVHQLFEKLIP